MLVATRQGFFCGGKKRTSVIGNPRRVVEFWSCIHVVAVWLWHAEGWFTRNDDLNAVLRRVIAFDANMETWELECGDWCTITAKMMTDFLVAEDNSYNE